MSLRTHAPRLTVIVCAAVLAGCASQGMREDPDALYYRLGARRIVSKLAADIVDTWAGDARLIVNSALKDKVAGKVRDELKRHVFEYLCWAGSGPCDTREKGLESALAAILPSPTEWFYLLEGVVVSLNKQHVPEREKNEVLELVYALQFKLIGGAQNPL